MCAPLPHRRTHPIPHSYPSCPRPAAESALEPTLQLLRLRLHHGPEANAVSGGFSSGIAVDMDADVPRELELQVPRKLSRHAPVEW